MDPFTSVGLAGNVVQFVDFSWKLLVEARHIAKSADGCGPNTKLLTTMVRDIEQANNSVQKVVIEDEDLSKLIAECENISCQLLDALQKLRLDDDHSKWQSFLVALKGVWNASDIETLFESLLHLHGRVLERIHFLTYDDVSELKSKMYDMDKRWEKLDIKIQDRLNPMVSMMAKTVGTALEHQSSFETKWRRWQSQHRKSGEPLAESAALETKDAEELASIPSWQHLSELVGIGSELAKLQRQGNESKADITFVESIYFTDILTRQRGIKERHSETFDWIFEPKYDGKSIHFSHWLEKESGIFWINGKPGSGKSTLMKFLYGNTRTGEKLQGWASEAKKDLVMAQYFFWRAGSQIQKSPEGLLRSLIFEILRKCPHLIQLARAAILMTDDIFEREEISGEWTQAQLLLVYKAIVSQSLSTRFCFFIDGLDEYFDGENHPEAIVHTVHELDFSEDIKLCISSRPYPEFQLRFGQNSERLLKVEDHTAKDIRRYVSDQFNKVDNYVRLCHKPEYSGFIDLIARKAHGVFLWVVLVVANMTHGFRRGDSAQQLRDRLDKYPEELEEFFGHMLSSIEDEYRRQAMRSFELVSDALQPLNLMVYWYMYAADEMANPASLWEEEAKAKLPAADIEENHYQMRLRLDARSHGLLEITEKGDTVQPIFRAKVDFIHRTVRDFLQNSPVINTHFKAELKSSPRSTWVLACHAILALFNEAPWKEGLQEEDIMKQLMRDLYFLANESVQSTNYPVQLEDAETMVTEAEKMYKRTAHLITTGKNPSSEFHEHPHRFFMCLDAQYGFANKLARRFPAISHRLRLNEGSDRPVLDYALVPVPGEGQVHYSANVVKILLDKGAKLNTVYRSESVWSRFVAALMDNEGQKKPSQRQLQAIVAILRLLFANKADLGAQVKTPHGTMSSTTALKEYLERNKLPSIAQLTKQSRKKFFRRN